MFLCVWDQSVVKLELQWEHVCLCVGSVCSKTVELQWDHVFLCGGSVCSKTVQREHVWFRDFCVGTLPTVCIKTVKLYSENMTDLGISVWEQSVSKL